MDECRVIYNVLNKGDTKKLYIFEDKSTFGIKANQPNNNGTESCKAKKVEDLLRSCYQGLPIDNGVEHDLMLRRGIGLGCIIY